MPPETPEVVAGKLNILQSNHRKTACILAWTVARLVERYGIERVGFFTLTFADNVTDPKEAQRRLNSLLTNVLQERYREWVRVFERQKAGRIHYHLLIVLPEDIRTGVDFVAFGAGDYSTASDFLRSEWAFWRDCAPRYGFGRTELLPVKSTGEGIARYVGKYISKHIENREEKDKGVRLVAMSRGARVGSTRFAWNTDGSWLWRRKLKLLAGALGVEEIVQMATLFGPRWAYRWKDIIARLQLSDYPSMEHALSDGRDLAFADVQRRGEFPMWRRENDALVIPCRFDVLSPGRIGVGEAVGEILSLVARSKRKGNGSMGAAASAQRDAKPGPLRGPMTRWPSADEASSAHLGRRGKMGGSSHPQDFSIDGINHLCQHSFDGSNAE